MDNFLKEMINGSGISPSEICLESFNENFTDAIDIEWFKKNNYYEAVFYKNNIEHIALFDFMGTLIEYRQNLTTEFLPEAIKIPALSKGEIMNIVLKNKGNMLEYELIVRDKELKRYLITATDTGEFIEEKTL